ncbi:MAG: L7Ae/L30e/S12e/Gadd45 family ribosomal protein [Longimicrobiales bacterium]
MRQSAAERRTNAAPDALGLLGLAARAGAVAAGGDAVRDAIRRRRAHLVVIAADVSANSRDKIMRPLTRQGIRGLEAFDRAVLGHAIGRAPVAAVAVLDARLARRIGDVLATGAAAGE